MCIRDRNFFAEQEAKAQAAAAEKGKVAKEAGEKFLAENGKKDGIITIQTLCTHRSQLATDADAQSITYFIHRCV